MRSKIVWPGNPPIPASRAQAWMGMCAFLVSIGRNGEFEPSPGQEGAVSDVLSEALFEKDAETRERLMQAHRIWLRCRATWDRADAARRLKLRWIATRLVNRTLPAGRRIPIGEDVPEDDLARWLRVAELVAEESSPFEAWTNLGRNPGIVIPAVEAWLDPLPQDLDDILLYR